MMQLNQPSAGVPKRVILPYAGLIADIPTGWFLCNGQNGTPDLTDSFILGGTEAQVGQIGGSQAVTPAGSVSTGIAGSVTVSNHTLSTAQMPSHRHTMKRGGGGNGNYNPYSGPGAHSSGNQWQYSYTEYEGSGGAHNHGAGHNLSASSGFAGAEQDNRPKFYKAAYIMYVG
jgi:hypothetical protein